MPSAGRRARSRPTDVGIWTAGRDPDRIANARRSAEALGDVLDHEAVEARTAGIAAADAGAPRHLPDLTQDLDDLVETDVADGDAHFAYSGATSRCCFGHVTLLGRC